MIKIYEKKLFILAVLSFAIIVFCINYKNTPNGISKIIKDIEDIAASSGNNVINEFNKISKVTQNEFIQFPIRFINSVLSIYIEAIILLLLFKIVNIFKKKKYDINLKKIIDVYYLSLYIVAINLLIQTIYMLVIGKSIDYKIDIYNCIYNLNFNILSSLIIVYFFKIKNNIILLPLILSLILVSGQFWISLIGIIN